MQAWHKLVQDLKKELGSDAYAAWVESIIVTQYDAGNLYLELKDSFHEHWFEQYIRPKLQSHFVNNNGRQIKIHVHVKDSNPKKTTSKENTWIPNLVIQNDPIDPFYTLDSFFIARQNTLPLKLIIDLCEERYEFDKYNPYYLYGTKGCGKTHLLMGIASYLQQRGKRVFFVNAETFTAHVVQAIRLGRMEEFRKIYRNSDVLIIDDIHLMTKRLATQEEFFHTFNALHTTGKQILLSGNAPAASLQGVEDRLISRFEWGIALQIASLTPVEFIPMASDLCKRLQISLSEQIVEWICNEFPSTSSISKALLAVALRIELGHQTKITLSDVKEVLRDLSLEEEKKLLTPKRIIEEVSKHFGIRTQDIYSYNKSREFSLPRQVAIYLCRMRLKEPYMKIGRLLGRDHSTILSSVKNIQKAIEKKNTEILNSIREIEKGLG